MFKVSIILFEMISCDFNLKSGISSLAKRQRVKFWNKLLHFFAKKHDCFKYLRNQRYLAGHVTEADIIDMQQIVIKTIF